MYIAATRAAAAGSAAETFAAIFVVLQTVCGDTGAIGSDQSPSFFKRLPQHYLTGHELIRTLKQTVRKMREIFLHTGDPKIVIDAIVVGFDVGIRYRPVLTEPIARRSLEIVIGKAQC